MPLRARWLFGLVSDSASLWVAILLRCFSMVVAGDHKQAIMKILSMRSAFECLGVRASGRESRKVVLSNCSADEKKHGWNLLLHREAFNQSINITVRIDSELCLAAEGRELKVQPCSVLTSWHWLESPFARDVEKETHGLQPYSLRHAVSGLCVAVVPTRFGDEAQLETCPEAATLKSCNPADPCYRFLWIAAAFPQLVPIADLPLRTVGSTLVGASGHVMKLRGINWHGVYTWRHAQLGLDQLSIAEIAQLILNLGFNTVRFSFGIQQYVENVRVEDKCIAANLQWRGMTSMEIFDECLRHLTSQGLAVILNNMVNNDGPCCSATDDNALWFNEKWSSKVWLEVLRNISRRYRSNPLVIGVDIKNEPRPDLSHKVNGQSWWVWWGNFLGVPRTGLDWRRAAQEGSKAVWHGNPDALAIVEGVGAVDVATVLSNPMHFGQDCLHTRVLYSVHDYFWFNQWDYFYGGTEGGRVSMRTRLWHLYSFLLHFAIRHDRFFQHCEQSYADYAANREMTFGFLVREDLAPVYMGEFGGELYPTRYLTELDMDWTHWSLFGGHSTLMPHASGNRTTWAVSSDAMWLSALAPALAHSGRQNASRPHPGVCVFDPSLPGNSVEDPVGHAGALSIEQTVLLAECVGLGMLVVLLTCCCRCIRHLSSGRNVSPSWRSKSPKLHGSYADANDLSEGLLPTKLSAADA